MRLVPYQTPQEITEKFTKYFEKIAPDTVKVKVTPHHGGMPYVLPTDTKEFAAAKQAMESAFGKKFFLTEEEEVFRLQQCLSRF